MTPGLPQFLGVGVQKGGTTTLHSLLRQHPEIFFPDKKEIHYFTLNYTKGEKWYKDHFSNQKTYQLSGEITPYYAFHPYSAERIARLLPDCKLIVLLRDPIDRALSQYFHSWRLGFESLNLIDALEIESSRLSQSNNLLSADDGFDKFHQENSYLARSKYDEQMVRILKYFKKDQVFVGKSEDMFKSPNLIIDQIINFLGIQPFEKFNYQCKEHKGIYSAITEGEINIARQWLSSKLEETYEFMEAEYQIIW